MHGCGYTWYVWLLSIDEMVLIFMVGKLMRMHALSHEHLKYNIEYELCNGINTNALNWLFLVICRKMVKMIA